MVSQPLSLLASIVKSWLCARTARSQGGGESGAGEGENIRVCWAIRAVDIPCAPNQPGNLSQCGADCTAPYWRPPPPPSHLQALARPMYSNPPLHGALLVHNILSDTKLKQQWCVGAVGGVASVELAWHTC